MSRRVLVTGATGFLGRNVLAALRATDGVEAIAACRTPSRLGAGFTGEVREGDLRDPDYRRTVVKDVDVVCHAGTWSSMWGHAAQERTHFLEPACDLVEQAIRAGADRVLVASTVAIGTPADAGAAVTPPDPTATRTPPSADPPTGTPPHADPPTGTPPHAEPATRTPPHAELATGTPPHADPRTGTSPDATPTGAPPDGRAAFDDFSSTRATGFWPHLDRLIDLDTFMRDNAHRGTRMITMRLGHFVGAGNVVGLVPALAPRLRTRLVPWIAGGRARLPLVADTDLGEAFVRAAVADGLDDYESFNICGPEYPTAREVIGFIAAEAGLPPPWYGVPRPAAHAFGWLMERLHPVLPGSSPFLTRSLVHLAGDWPCPGHYAAWKLGYIPRKDWRTAVRESLTELRAEGYPWPRLAQPS